jgi:hypothetical protein
MLELFFHFLNSAAALQPSAPDSCVAWPAAGTRVVSQPSISISPIQDDARTAFLCPVGAAKRDDSGSGIARDGR